MPQVVNGVVNIPLSGQPLECDSRSARRCEKTPGLGEFVAGPENCLVDEAVRSVLEETAPYSLLVLYGPPGTGKSHLALGLAAAWKTLYPRRPVAYVTAIDFARELTDAIETQAVDDFRAGYRRTSLLIVEDLGYLAGKEAAQRELVYTLDALADAGGRLVLTAPVAPGQLAGMVPGLQSRLTAGLAVPLARPGREARLTILQRLAGLREIQLSGAAARLLAEGLNATVSGLLGALLQLEMAARVNGERIDGDAVRRYLAERNGSEERSMHDIALATARHFSLKLAELRGPSRRRAVAAARGVAMYLTRVLTRQSLEQIGRYFGGRDHTTVSYACRKTEERVKGEPAVRQAVLILHEQLQTK